MMTIYANGTDRSGYFHLCSDGSLTPQFLTCEEDYRVAFNLIGVCAANCDATVLSFSLEDTHLHLLLYGTKESCVRFKTMYEESWAHHVGRVRGNRDGAEIELDIIPINNQDYLMNVGTYTIVQPTNALRLSLGNRIDVFPFGSAPVDLDDRWRWVQSHNCASRHTARPGTQKNPWISPRYSWRVAAVRWVVATRQLCGCLPL